MKIIKIFGFAIHLILYWNSAYSQSLVDTEELKSKHAFSLRPIQSIAVQEFNIYYDYGINTKTTYSFSVGYIAKSIDLGLVGIFEQKAIPLSILRYGHGFVLRTGIKFRNGNTNNKKTKLYTSLIADYKFRIIPKTETVLNFTPNRDFVRGEFAGITNRLGIVLSEGLHVLLNPIFIDLSIGGGFFLRRDFLQYYYTIDLNSGEKNYLPPNTIHLGIPTDLKIKIFPTIQGIVKIGVVI